MHLTYATAFALNASCMSYSDVSDLANATATGDLGRVFRVSIILRSAANKRDGTAGSGSGYAKHAVPHCCYAVFVIKIDVFVGLFPP